MIASYFLWRSTWSPCRGLVNRIIHAQVPGMLTSSNNSVYALSFCTRRYILIPGEAHTDLRADFIQDLGHGKRLAERQLRVLGQALFQRLLHCRSLIFQALRAYEVVPRCQTNVRRVEGLRHSDSLPTQEHWVRGVALASHHGVSLRGLHWTAYPDVARLTHNGDIIWQCACEAALEVSHRSAIVLKGGEGLRIDACVQHAGVSAHLLRRAENHGDPECRVDAQVKECTTSKLWLK
mmetsp:Transcript_157646/g.302613  ORF Transcript_157646/g.302613 Transcript_157646/m.302613 type:complete len:236 (-) Transcript_157646:469-1176(-)